jgi:hypothetical protein
MCDTVIWLEGGGIRLIGPVDYVTTKYDEDLLKSDDETVRPANIQRVEKSIYFITTDEVCSLDVVRLRLRVLEKNRVAGIHYIRDIKVKYKVNSLEETISIPLNTYNEDGSFLDLMGCEWGRLYSKKDVVARMLAPRTGARKGGHFLIKRPNEFVSQSWPVQVEWTAMSDTPDSELAIEFIDYEEAIWKCFEIISKKALGNGWTRFTAAGLLLPVDDRIKEQALVIANERRISPIEIVDVIIITKNGRSNSVLEKQPFFIQIDIECLENAPNFSVCLQINRSDGAYMFWQPSDFHDKVDLSGAKYVTIKYYFDENYFSSGEYEISATAITAPWHKDIVQSEIEIFDRKLSIVRFNVVREFKNLMFGAINYRARVGIHKSNITF